MASCQQNHCLLTRHCLHPGGWCAALHINSMIRVVSNLLFLRLMHIPCYRCRSLTLHVSNFTHLHFVLVQLRRVLFSCLTTRGNPTVAPHYAMCRSLAGSAAHGRACSCFVVPLCDVCLPNTSIHRRFTASSRNRLMCRCLAASTAPGRACSCSVSTSTGCASTLCT